MRDLWRSYAAWSPPMWMRMSVLGRVGWGRGWLGVRSVGDVSREDRPERAGALELEEAGSPGHEQAAVPQLARRLALGRRGDDRPEERDPVDGDDRRADVGTHQADATLVAAVQGRVVLLVVRLLGQRRRQPDLRERLAD